MKVCIYGAGAIGGWMGVRLAQAGCDVSVVARGPTLNALTTRGLQLVEKDATHTAQVRASGAPEALGNKTSWWSPSKRRQWNPWLRTSRRYSARGPRCSPP